MAWDKFATADEIDRSVFLYTGADPVWTPEREIKLPDAPDAAPGECHLCGGRAGDGVAFEDDEGNRVIVVAGAIPRGSHRICARCMRSGTDPRSQPAPTCEASPAPVACKSDPGYVERNGVKVPERFARLMKG